MAWILMKTELFHSKRLTRRGIISLLVAFILYIVIYGILSMNGSYAPMRVGISGVRSYVWAPLGFYDDEHPWKGSVAARKANVTKYGGWNRQWTLLFYPLWSIDVRYIHRAK